MAKPRDPNSSRRTRRIVAGVAIAAFLVVDAALLYGALMTTSGSDPAAAPLSPAATEPSTPIDSVKAPAVTPATRLISAYDGTSAWRMTTGACPASDVLVEHSDDSGKTWNGFDLGTTGGLSTASALGALDDADSVYLLAFAKVDCSPSWVGTTTGGREWAAFPDRTATAWFVNPANRAMVNAPGAYRTAPCPSVVGLAALDANNAAVLCSDQSVYRTVDNGATWVLAPATAGAEAIGTGADDYLLVSSSTDATCAGTTMASLPSATDGKPSVISKCIATTATSGTDLAVSGTEDAIWLWAGSTVLRSIDEGTTWK